MALIHDPVTRSCQSHAKLSCLWRRVLSMMPYSSKATVSWSRSSALVSLSLLISLLSHPLCNSLVSFALLICHHYYACSSFRLSLSPTSRLHPSTFHLFIPRFHHSHHCHLFISFQLSYIHSSFFLLPNRRCTILSSHSSRFVASP